MIIGRMMASRHQLAEAIAFIENKPGFFTDPAHQRLYETMCIMFGKYQEVDVTTVLVQLKKHKGFEKGDIDKCLAEQREAAKALTKRVQNRFRLDLALYVSRRQTPTLSTASATLS